MLGGGRQHTLGPRRGYISVCVSVVSALLNAWFSLPDMGLGYFLDILPEMSVRQIVAKWGKSPLQV